MTAAALRTGWILALVLMLAAATAVRNRIFAEPRLMWEDVVRKSPGKARGYNNLGTIYHGLDRPADAMRAFRRVAELDPLALLYAYGNIGNLYIDMKDYAKAEELFTRLLGVQSADNQSYVGRGKARYGLGKYRPALADLDRAIALSPSVARYYLYRAEILLKLEENGRARQDLVRSCDMGWKEGCEQLEELKRTGAFRR